MKLTTEQVRQIIKEELSKFLLSEMETLQLRGDSLMLYFSQKKNEPHYDSLLGLKKTPVYEPADHPCFGEQGQKRFQPNAQLYRKILELSQQTVTKKKEPGEQEKETDAVFRTATQQNPYGEQIYGMYNKLADQAIETAKDIIAAISKFRKKEQDRVHLFMQYKCGLALSADANRPIFNLLNFIRIQDTIKILEKNE